MQIEFPEKHWVHEERDVVTFPAIVDGKGVTCTITAEEMERMTGTVVMPGTMGDVFTRLRPEIENRTRERIINKPR